MANRPHVSRPPRILIASDRNHNLREVEDFLSRHGHSVLRVFAGTPVLDRARSGRPDVILLDSTLADRDSLELSRALREDRLIGASTPILLMVPAHPTPQDHHAALRAGIWELLPQPMNANELLFKLDVYMRAKVEAERARGEKLVDDLTGLYTVQGLAHRARELIFQASQHNTSAACVVFAPELEVKPEARDVPGPAAATLVRRVAQVFKAHGRRSDAIGRVGLTEVAVVAPGTGAGGAVLLAERFRSAVRAGGIPGAGVEPLIRLRAGYDAVANVRYTPIEPNTLLAHAARALQLAKAEGKWIRESSERP